MLLTEIRPQHVKAFVRHVSERRRRGERYAKDLDPVSQNTVRLALAPVKIVLATAFEEGLIRVNPAAGVRIVVPRDLVDDEDELGQVKALTDAELTLVMKKLPGATPGKPLLWRLFFHVLLHLGLRIGEAIELRWRDVDLGKGTVRIRRKYFEGEVGPPKSRFGRRTLKLTDELSAALWELRKQTRGLDDDLVFVSPRGHRIIPSNLESRVLKPAAIAAGVPWVNCHTFRHTCATLLFTKGGWNAKQVQLWLGHHSPTFTIERYVHLLPDDLPEPVQLTLLALEQVDDVQAAVTA
jgi:integrase